MASVSNSSAGGTPDTTKARFPRKGKRAFMFFDV